MKILRKANIFNTIDAMKSQVELVQVSKVETTAKKTFVATCRLGSAISERSKSLLSNFVARNASFDFHNIPVDEVNKHKDVIFYYDNRLTSKDLEVIQKRKGRQFYVNQDKDVAHQRHTYIIKNGGACEVLTEELFNQLEKETKATSLVNFLENDCRKDYNALLNNIVVELRKLELFSDVDYKNPVQFKNMLDTMNNELADCGYEFNSAGTQTVQEKMNVYDGHGTKFDLGASKVERRVYGTTQVGNGFVEDLTKKSFDEHTCYVHTEDRAKMVYSYIPALETMRNYLQLQWYKKLNVPTDAEQAPASTLIEEVESLAFME